MRRSIVREVAAEVFGEEYANLMTRSYDIIGDIIIIKLPDKFLQKRFLYGEKLLERMPYIKVVYRQVEPVRGTYRIRRLEHLAGEERTWTIYKEHGIRLKVDVEKTYFSPRLSTERLRIMKLVEDGETIINMFAGVGSYSILIAKYKNIHHIHSIDINPVAIDYHLENNIINKVEDKITLYRGDAGEMIDKYLTNIGDRILMPLPERAIEYLKYAIKALKDIGWIHIYLHISYKDRWQEAIKEGIKLVKNKIGERYSIKEIDGTKVREVAPRILQVCINTYIKKKT
jgi:tRNA (guanine37-N1)-methyltransferase